MGKKIALLLFLFASPAIAAERKNLCAKYETQHGWSRSYSVEGTITDGAELNQATNSWRYQSYATYVVIFWGQGEASVIKMRLPFVGYVDADGIDQDGTHWKVREGDYCY